MHDVGSRFASKPKASYSPSKTRRNPIASDTLNGKAIVEPYVALRSSGAPLRLL